MLAELDDTDAKLAVDAAMASLAVVEVSIPPKDRALPAQEFRLAEAEVKKAQVEVARAKAALQATKLVAPVAGTVVELNVAAGDVVTPTGPALAVIADLRSLAAVVDVAEADAARVAVGQECVVQVGANRTEFPGVVVGVAATLDLGTATIPVRVRFSTSNGSAGLTRMCRNPACRARSSTSREPYPVTAMSSEVRGRAAANSSATWKPSFFGRPMSQTTAWGRPARAAATPASPSEVSVTS
jgi:pyruvate/2-oxoglutarate dehydrogenase complex dihydrolipoamide acyltransferase (E2) component